MCFLYPSVVWQSWRRDWNRMKYLVFQPGSKYPYALSLLNLR